MENVLISEPVEVGAVFGKNRIRPKWFFWRNRRYMIKETTFVWNDSEGEAKMVRFSVTDGSTMFELSLNQKTLAWRLERTEVR